LIGACAVQAGVAIAADDANLSQLRGKLAKDLEISPEDIRPSPIPGMFEVQHNHDFAYVSADGKYIIKGDLIDVQTREKITENRRRADRLASLAAFGPKDYIEFAPPPPLATKYTLMVFTDVDCGYCRKLHSQIGEYNSLGIAIRYLSFPRTGPDTSSWHKAEAVWCADDRKTALTRAKRDEPVKSKSCDNPVAKEYQLGVDLGLAGTPLLILPNGEEQPGYIPPKDLLAELESIAAEGKAAAVKSASAVP
jgi:thiol:disulfide interchange protein DsbC